MNTNQEPTAKTLSQRLDDLEGKAKNLRPQIQQLLDFRDMCNAAYESDLARYRQELFQFHKTRG